MFVFILFSVQIRMKKAITISAILVIFIAIFVARYGNFKFAFPLKKEEEPAFEMHINESVICFQVKLSLD